MQDEILQRADAIMSTAAAGSVIDNRVAAAAASFLADSANEVETPCVRRFGPDIDPWEERIQHLREMVGMTSQLVFESVSEEAALPSGDPRREKLKLIADRIGELVSEALEAAIEAVKQDNTPSVSSDVRPTI